VVSGAEWPAEFCWENIPAHPRILAKIKDAIQKGELVVQNAKGDKMSGEELTDLLSQKPK
jgi:hypothetical protein